MGAAADPPTDLLETDQGAWHDARPLSFCPGGRRTPFFSTYRPQFHFRTADVVGVVDLGEVSMAMPGDTVDLAVDLGKPVAMSEGLGFAMREGGRTVAAGAVTQLLD